MKFQVKAEPIPQWLDWGRLLGPGEWIEKQREDGNLALEAELDRAEAADLRARLRGVGIGGSLIMLEVRPTPNRKEQRSAANDEAKRHRERSVGFSKKGVQLDDEGRFSLTPEAIALELGKRVSGMRVIDACAGVGGNAIGFARAGCEVVAIEIDPDRMEMAKHNAELYGVADRIEFVCEDAREMVSKRAADLLFIDAPWGERYNKECVSLADLAPCEDLLAQADHLPMKWLKVPPSFDPSSLPGCDVEAVFGVGRGDARRVKFLLLEV